MSLSDLEISKALALAIGWKEKQIRLTYEFGVQVCTDAPISCYTSLPWWRGFDYRDWNVIGPIAEKFDCFPSIATYSSDKWFAYTPNDSLTEIYANTPQKAVAMAVIQRTKK